MVLTTKFPETATALRLSAATDTTAVSPTSEMPAAYRRDLQAARRGATSDSEIAGYRSIAVSRPEYDTKAVARRRRPTWADE